MTAGLAFAASALRRFTSSVEEAEIADVLDHIQDAHYPGRTNLCAGCAADDVSATWPCPLYVYGQHLAVQYIGRAVDRVAWHASSVLKRPAAQHEEAA